MKLSISNIAWGKENDKLVYQYLKKQELAAIEIAPTRIFPFNPYDSLVEAINFRDELYNKYGLKISSIQSIWYGRSEKVFGSTAERQQLIDYTKKAIDFASALECHNLVFGCPKNRVIASIGDYDIALEFFFELGEYAAQKNTVLALEANPVIYHTNFMNKTEDALDMVKRISSSGCLVNLDLGTMIYNEENLDIISDSLHFINHIHISEPNLAIIEKRELHKALARVLKDSYTGYVSVEMGKQNDITNVFDTVTYIREVFS